MRIGYKREINHNYIEIEQDEDYFEYQVEMITRNKIKGLLGCVREQVDNKTTFLYEINSKQPFVQLFEKTKVDYSTFYQILESLKITIEEVELYLLDANSLVLNPEYIYMNPETKEIELIYLPGYWENMKEGLHELAQQLLNWIDYKNEKVVAAAYELFKQTSEENYTFEMIINNLNKKAKEQEEKQQRSIRTEWEELEEEKYNDVQNNQNNENTQTNYIDETYDMEADMKEEMSFWDKVKVPVMGTAGHFLRNIMNFMKRKDDMGFEQEDEKEFAYEKSYVMEQRHARFPVGYGQIAEESVYGNTVFLKNEKESLIPMLVAEAEQYQDFQLMIFPFIIGKLTEAVDGIVDEATVSRIHGKIEKKDGQYYLIDLNSTNGTYLNGKLLAPNEKTKLQPDDRIQFGSVSYYFKLDSANNSSH